MRDEVSLAMAYPDIHPCMEDSSDGNKKPVMS
jgi:hypothetical protein